MSDVGQTGLTRQGACLAGAGLVYLAVPNLLFLAGWFAPPVALAAGCLLVLCVGRAFWRLVRGSAPGERGSGARMAGALAVIILLFSLFFLRDGIVGVFETHGDYLVFRQALFCNVRDAAWPVVLPNGKEMTYYLANILPPALLARLLPADCSQWCIVLWSALPVSLALLILADRPAVRRWKFWGLFAVPFAVFLIRDPLYALLQTHIGCFLQGLAEHAGVDCYIFFCQNGGVLNPLVECTGAYNSVPPTLLAAAILARGGGENRVLVPLVYALLFACAPIACIGLLPVALVLYIRAWRNTGFRLRAMVAECPLPTVMLSLCLLYYARGDGGVFFTLSGFRVGWADAIATQCRVWVAWALLVLPLAKEEKANGLFLAVAAFLFIGPFLYLGSPESLYNELWLKASPAYLVLLACFHAKHWRTLPKWKYAIAALCLLGALHTVAKPWVTADFSRYGAVDDAWNGHLNHDHPFLNQSVPPTHEPLVPGVLLRVPGEAEKHFPGSLLPAAPGCDYSRPAHPELMNR